MISLRLPGPTGLAAIGAAVVAWCGTAAGWWWGPAALAVGLVVAVALVAGRRLVVAVLLLASLLSGWAAATRVEATLAAVVPAGPVVLSGRVADEPVPGPGGVRFVLVPEQRQTAGTWKTVDLPPVAVAPRSEQYLPTAGDHVLVRGSLRAAPGRVRGDPVAGRISGASVAFLAESNNPVFSVGNALRRRVAGRLEKGDNPATASLLRGFLIGDTSGLAADDAEALRRAGLSHFVAVSGSNVALFLAGWWLVTAPIATRPRARAALGLAGLAVFVVVTRWEPSVVRAAAMAGLVLGGRLLGVPVDAWTALGSATAGLLLLSGDLATSVGFQLSVFATAGVLVGAGMFRTRRPRWLWTALGATLSAQAAVVPLLLIHFGTVPLLSPVANLAAAPLVTMATVLGGVGVVAGWDLLVEPGLAAAGAVLHIARTASDWPQLGHGGVAGLAGVVWLMRWRSMRPIVAAAGLVTLLAVCAPGSAPNATTITFLDVGQGDAVLLQDESGASVLVDGGREPRVLHDALKRHGVRRLDLLVVTHGDADHAGGLQDIVARVPVGRIWVPDQPQLGEIVPGVLDAAARLGITVHRVRAGPSLRLGGFAFTVLGPARRYASPNDGSIVLWVEVGDRTVLLPGDIEAVAQRELPPLQPDIMLVPHHGSGTTDLVWLRATLGAHAVISVGENSYGHPAPEVLTTLAESGATVWITEDVGDVSVRLG